ncbi:low molecular weight phosphatase family protein [Mycobacterium sp. PSTR-4-N]|uniref:arsenate reductase/protein-tyrosine-phosphatase family protein n=1 Tax=Mycobacterium sp. PSTR-4-N TaxID=2917745 RepID=UPI0027E1F59B|nr:low molecular weight phosphatase family protein [Mycobacterium sp. PSTR-4-N]
MFVCTGNICRSPIAERLSTFYALERNMSSFRASSAGTRALVGHPIHPEAAHALKRRGADPSDFEARRLTTRGVASADLILGMTKAHRDAVLELAPQALRKCFTLAEASTLAVRFEAGDVTTLSAVRSQITLTEFLDITDPIDQRAEIFEIVAGQIAELLPPILGLG